MPSLKDLLLRVFKRGPLAAPAKDGHRKWSRPAVAGGLTPQRLAAMWRAADNGDNRDLLSLAAEIPRRDAHVFAQLGTRTAALLGLRWRAEAVTDSAADVAAADELQALLDSDAWTLAVGGCASAWLPGYSITELVWTYGKRWTPTFQTRDPAHFQVGEEGHTLLLRDGSNTGAPLPPGRFAVHRPQPAAPLALSGLVRPMSVLHLLKTQGLRSWAAFCELYGVPTRIGKYGPAASAADIDKLMEAIVAIGEDGAGVMPDTTKVEILKVEKGPGVHRDLAEWVDRANSKLILGQTMTAEDGSSRSQAEVHDEVRRDYLVADGKAIAATLRRDVVAPWYLVNFGEGAPPKLEPQYETADDRKLFVETLIPLVDRGLPVELSVIADRMGLPVAPEGAAILGRRPVGSGAQVAARRVSGCCGVAHASLAPPSTPVVEAARSAAQSATGFADFERRLDDATNATTFVADLAAATLRVRGIGDLTDDVPQDLA